VTLFHSQRVTSSRDDHWNESMKDKNPLKQSAHHLPVPLCSPDIVIDV
jgi:hypothetical protein